MKINHAIDSNMHDLFYSLEANHKKAAETHRALAFNLAREGKRLTAEDDATILKIQQDAIDSAVRMGELHGRLDKLGDDPKKDTPKEATNADADPDDDIPMEDVNEPIKKRGPIGRWWARVTGAGRE
jgi:hypothetical protein